jgi:NAD-dependent dihydropyrimidine dehydrogenase PreA subunit
MLKYLKGVTTLKLDSDKCVGCGMCVEVCPHCVFSMSERKALIVDVDACMECGACAINCPAAAISVDTGVGCASAVIASWFNGGEVTCDCGEGECC